MSVTLVGEARPVRQTICLCMIVKDEAKTLPRLFESCKDHIDYWVICDTGSTDGTQALICHDLSGIPGELHQRDWVNFGVNRSELMEYARGKSDYLLILDADMTLEVALGALDHLTEDAYMLRHVGSGVQYYTKRLVRGALKWRYVGAVHEYILSEEEDTTGRLDEVVIRSWSVGAVRKGRFERDIELLTQDLRDDPTNARAQFYLAQTCRDIAVQHKDNRTLASAADHYQRRAERPGWDEETYFAQYQVGVLAAQLGDWPRAMDAYMRAWEVRPERLEAVHDLAAGLLERRQYRTAHQFTRLASYRRGLPVPDDVLFISPWVYEWGLLFQHSIAAYWCGEYDAAITACRRLLRIDVLPDGHRRQTLRNLQHAVREKVRQATEPAPASRTWAHSGRPTRGRAALSAADRR